jgi:hypothetical protein
LGKDGDPSNGSKFFGTTLLGTIFAYAFPSKVVSTSDEGHSC